MSGGGNLEVFVFLTLYIVAIWLVGTIFQKFNISPILGLIIVGVVMGPKVLDIVPYAAPTPHTDCVINATLNMDGGHEDIAVHSVNETDGHADDGPVRTAGDVSLHHCEADPPFFVLLGQIGVTLMIAESGMHINFGKLRVVGLRACVVAVIGTFFPLAAGVGTIAALGYDVYPDGLTAGVVLAPTSVGIALKLLVDEKQLSSDYGQTIVTAAFVDDILSLILFVVMLNVASGTVTALSVLAPILYCVLFLTYGVVMALFVMPRVVPWLLSKVPDDPSASFQPRDIAHLFLMFVLLIGYAIIGSFIGSHLLGAFVAGLTFCRVPRSMMIWHKQVKRIAAWLIRFFFAATVAFSIPIDTMLSASAFAGGIIVGVGPTIIPKMIAGVFQGPTRWIVGAAMMGRGEFAYFIAENALITPMLGLPGAPMMIGPEVYSIVVWALLIATIVTPFLFRFLLQHHLKRLKTAPGATDFMVRVEGYHHTGLVHEVCDVLHHLNLDVIEAQIESDGLVDVQVFKVHSRGGKKIEADKMDELLHEILEAMNDENAQIVLEPVLKTQAEDVCGGCNDEVPQFYCPDCNEIYCSSCAISFHKEEKHSLTVMEVGRWLEIKLMTRHHADLFHEIVELLESLDTVITTVTLEDVRGIDSFMFFVRDVDHGKIEGRVKMIRDKISACFESHGSKGTAMIKPINYDVALAPVEQVRLPTDSATQTLLKIEIGIRDQVPLTNLTARLRELQLDTVTCKAVLSSSGDEVMIFYCRDETMSGTKRVQEVQSSMQSFFYYELEDGAERDLDIHVTPFDCCQEDYHKASKAVGVTRQLSMRHLDRQESRSSAGRSSGLKRMDSFATWNSRIYRTNSFGSQRHLTASFPGLNGHGRRTPSTNSRSLDDDDDDAGAAAHRGEGDSPAVYDSSSSLDNSELAFLNSVSNSATSEDLRVVATGRPLTSMNGGMHLV